MTRKLSVLAIVPVLAITGAYTLIYLFRWEWNRAIITGIFFLAAELALAIVLLLRRFTRLEHRLDRMEAPNQPAPSSTRSCSTDCGSLRLRPGVPSRGSTLASRRSTRTCSCRSCSVSAPWPPLWHGSSNMSLGAPLHRSSSTRLACAR